MWRRFCLCHTFVASALVALLLISDSPRSQPCAQSPTPSTRPGTPSKYVDVDVDAETDAYLDGVLEEYARTKNDRLHVLISNAPSSEGLGSRLMGLVSGFYIALALNFSLSIRWSTGSKLVEGKLATMVHFDRLFQSNHSTKKDFPSTYTPDRTLFLGYAGVHKNNLLVRMMELFGCRDFIDELKDHKLFKFTTTTYIIPLIRHNPSVRHYEFIRRTWNYTRLYQKLVSFLLRPARYIAEHVASISQSLLPGVNICVHHRHVTGKAARSVEQCTENCLSRVVKQNQARGVASRIYLASNDANFRDRLKITYDNQLVLTNTSLERKTNEGLVGAIAEILLLQLCEGDGIFEPQSTFGVLGLAGKTARNAVAWNAKTCEQIALFEPCFRLWHWMGHLQCHRNRTARPWKLAWTDPSGFGMVECVNEKLD